MPRTEKFSTDDRPSLTASAYTVPTGSGSTTMATTAQKVAQPRRDSQGWQELSWLFYDTVGEYRYSVNWVGNVLSRATLYVAKDGKKTTEAFPNEVLDALYGGVDQQPEMLRQIGIHYTAAGGFYLVGETAPNGEDDGDWFVVAETELKFGADGSVSIDGRVLRTAFVQRYFRPHPRKLWQSDAPARAVLPVLSELVGLTKRIAAQINSRLAGNGLLFLPNEGITFAASTTGENAEARTDMSQFAVELQETMSLALRNPEDASAMVPIVVTMAGEWIDKVTHLMFASELDTEGVALRTEAIRRLALGMDMPPEILTGTSDMNHWSSWQLEEASIKAHTEPLLEVLTRDLSKGYLRPLLQTDFTDSDGTILQGLTQEEASHYAIMADTSGMRVQPNRSAEAIEMYDRGELNGAAMLRENGFSPDDAMSSDELVTWLAMKIASGSPSPDLVQSALKYLGLELEPTPQERQTQTEIIGPDGEVLVPSGAGLAPAAKAAPAGSGTTQTPPAVQPTSHDSPTLDNHPNRSAPVAASALVYRALERAGNRQRTALTGKLPDGVRAFETYMYAPVKKNQLDTLLADAWGLCDVVDVGYPKEKLVAALDSYTRGIMLAQKAPSMEGIQTFLTAIEA